MWVYIQSEPLLWTVGFFDPSGKFHSDSDHATRALAAGRCRWLNGGPLPPPEDERPYEDDEAPSGQWGGRG